jgi:hypothetical protein
MPYYILHAGTALEKLSTAGNIAAITLPAGVTMVSTRPARMAILASRIVVVNAVSVNVVIDALTLTATKLSLTAPASAPSLAAGASGTPNGTYRYKVSFAITTGGVVTHESPFSAVAGPVTVASQQVDLSSIPTSGEAGVNTRRIYRTTNGGVDYFLAATIADNTTTTHTDNASDYDLGLLTTEGDLGNPPGVDGTDRLRLIIAWKDRLWASPNNNKDRVHYTGLQSPVKWRSTNFLTMKPLGEDEIGVTAFLARRDELGVGKKRRFYKVIGEGPSTWQVINVHEGIGPTSQEATLVVRDVGYFLAEDGFYRWGPEGLTNLSRERVHPWFTTDDFFNRAQFANAFAKWNPLYDTIELHLAAAGSNDIDRWVSYEIQSGKWWGPHKTGAFTPTMAGLMDDANGFPVPMTGSAAGFVYQGNSSTVSDDGTAVELNAELAFLGANTPDIEKLFLQPAVINKIEAGGTLSVVPTAGALNASEQTTISLSLTTGRHRPRRLGVGRFLKLRFYNNEDQRNVEIYGVEVPFHEVGRR